MTERAFGRKTNFGGAYTYAHLLDTHKRLMTTDQEYADLLNNNPDLWFAAQMIFPITPFDMGVSLNRFPRYMGGGLGLWQAYNESSDPLLAIQRGAVLGPIYDIEMMQRVQQELVSEPTFKGYVTRDLTVEPLRAPFANIGDTERLDVPRDRWITLAEMQNAWKKTRDKVSSALAHGQPPAAPSLAPYVPPTFRPALIGQPSP